MRMLLGWGETDVEQILSDKVAMISKVDLQLTDWKNDLQKGILLTAQQKLPDVLKF